MGMTGTSSTLTVYFDGQFWVGLMEHVDGSHYGCVRQVFGAEPSAEELHRFVLARWSSIRFPMGEGRPQDPLPTNPKRRQREVARTLGDRGPSTKAQEALARQREACARERKGRERDRKAMDAEARSELRKERRKRRHRGR